MQAYCSQRETGGDRRCKLSRIVTFELVNQNSRYIIFIVENGDVEGNTKDP